VIPYDLGLNIVPFAVNEGRKTPLVPSWREYVERRQSVDEYARLNGASHLAVVAGVGFDGRPGLVAVDVDYDRVERVAADYIFKNLVELFSLAVQETPHGRHYYFFTNEKLDSAVLGPFELKARGNLVIVEGPGYAPIDWSRVPTINGPRLAKLVRSIETLARAVEVVGLDVDFLRELHSEGWRSEADYRLFVTLVRAGFKRDEVARAWALLSGKALAEDRRGTPPTYFTLTYHKAVQAVEEEREREEKGAEKPAPKPILAKALPTAVLEAVAEDLGGEYRPLLLVYDGRGFETAEQYTNGEIVYVPRKPASYPYPPYIFRPSPVKTREELLDIVFEQVDKFLDLERHYKIIITASILLSYIQEFFQTVPYLYFVGDNESGKSHALTLFRELCYRPFSGVSHTAADLYSYLEEDIPMTIIEDEFQGSEHDNEKMKIYKSGYKKGEKVGRVQLLETARIIKYFNTYGLKIIAAEQLTENKGFNQRCIVIEMVEGFPAKDHYDDDDFKMFHEIRNELLKWRMKTLYDKSLESEATMLRGRMREIFSPLLSILKGHRFYDEFLEWLKSEEERRLNEKRLSLEGQLTAIVYGLCMASATLDSVKVTLPFSSIWSEILNTMDGKYDAEKESFSSLLHGVITKQKIGRRLREIFGAQRERRRDGIYYVFELGKIGRMARKYRIEDLGESS